MAATISAVVAGEAGAGVVCAAVGPGVTGMFAACMVGVVGRTNGNRSFEKMLKS